MKDLMRAYERARYPDDQRLDLHGEGPEAARDRALHWIQSRAHEFPGQELLIIVERGRRPGKPPSAVAKAIEKLLAELEGKLVAWWQPFAPGSLALKIAPSPTLIPREGAKAKPRASDRATDDRQVFLGISVDIPPELLQTVRETASLRAAREGLTRRAEDLYLREIWIEVQARAMSRRETFDESLKAIQAAERAKQFEAD